MSQCRSCNAEIRFGLTAKGKRMPLDAEPVYVGFDSIRGLQVFDGRLRQATLQDVEDGRELYRPHFATCPQAASHRRR